MFSWVIAGILLLANLLTGAKRRVGWLVGSAGDLAFAVWGFATAQYGFTFGSAVFFVVRIRNYVRWRRADASTVSPGTSCWRRDEQPGRPLAGEPQVVPIATPRGTFHVLLDKEFGRSLAFASTVKGKSKLGENS